MTDSEKIKMLEDILNKDMVTKEEPTDSKGVLKVTAVGSTPEQAKEKILKGLDKVSLPDKSKMPDMMDNQDSEEEPDNCDNCDEEEFDESALEPDDQDIMALLPESQKAQFKQRLIDKIKNM